MEHRALEGPKTNLLIANDASLLSRFSLKFSFSRNNDYRDNHVIFFTKNDYRLEPFFREKRREMIIIVNLSHQLLTPLPWGVSCPHPGRPWVPPSSYTPPLGGVLPASWASMGAAIFFSSLLGMLLHPLLLLLSRTVKYMYVYNFSL